MFYQYFCEQNGKTVEVQHRVSERLKTWGEVCERAGKKPGSTPLNTPVIRMISNPNPIVWRLKGIDKDKPSKKLEL